MIVYGDNAPECLHVHGGLEHKEGMCFIMGVEFFAIRAKVRRTEGTVVPLSNNALHVPVAKGECMRNVAQISWNDPIKNLRLDASDKFWSSYVPAGSPDISAAGVPGTGPAGS
jgi:hypothetical protein